MSKAYRVYFNKYNLDYFHVFAAILESDIFAAETAEEAKRKFKELRGIDAVDVIEMDCSYEDLVANMTKASKLYETTKSK